MAFTRKTELRHIGVELNKVAKMLYQTPDWKKLMLIIPSEFHHPEQLNDGKTKYKAEHVRILENASFTDRRLPTEIFLEEWATSGKIRPTLSHLLQLLVNCELFRAADYVATLLSESPPQRPTNGPAARVDISLPYDDESGVSQSNSSSTVNNKNIYLKQSFDNVVKVPTLSENQQTNISRSHLFSQLPDVLSPVNSLIIDQVINQQSQNMPLTRSHESQNDQLYLNDTQKSFIPPISQLIDNQSIPTNNSTTTKSSASDQSSSESHPNLSIFINDLSLTSSIPSESDIIPKFSGLDISSSLSDSSSVSEGSLPIHLTQFTDESLNGIRL